jgi:hypothetical protein
MTTYTETQRPNTSGIGLTGRLVVGGTASTGLLLGGFTVAAFTLMGRMNGSALLITSMGLFIVGAVIGLVVSTTAGLVGRDDGVTLRQAVRQAAMGMLYAIPALLFSALLAGWIAMAVVGLYLGKAGPMIGSAMAAVIAAIIMIATAVCTWDCFANMARRVRQAF